jgi:hypothetical protein
MRAILSLALLALLGCAGDQCWHVNRDAGSPAQYRYGNSGGCAVYLWDDGTWNGVVLLSYGAVSQQFKTQLEAMHWVERMCPQ